MKDSMLSNQKFKDLFDMSKSCQMPLPNVKLNNCLFFLYSVNPY